MKIALYYPWIYLTSGAERTIGEFAARSRHEISIFTSHYEPENTFPIFRELNVTELRRVAVRRTPGAFAHAVWTVIRERLPLENFDVLLVVSEGIGDLLLFRNSTIPAICLSLTPLRIAFDDAYARRRLEELSWVDAAVVKMGAAAFRIADRIACKRYSKMICISEEARRRLIAGRLSIGEQIRILNPAISFHPPARSNRFDRFFLIAGRIMWTKNIELGIEAFRRFAAQAGHEDWRLVIAGMVDRKSEPYLERLLELAHGDSRIEFVISPSDDRLAELFSTCYSVLYTPFNEDYGLIPIEAMAFGKPSIACARGGPLETIRDGIDGLLRPATPEAFAQTMDELVANPERVVELGKNGFRKAARHTWSTFTDEMDLILEQTAAYRMITPRVEMPIRAESQ